MKVITSVSGEELRDYLAKNSIKETKDIKVFPENNCSPLEQASIMKNLLSSNFDGEIYTFSAYVISDTKEEDLYILKNEKLKRDCLNFNNFGASINKITMNLFNQRQTIGDVSANRLSSILENKVDNLKEIKNKIAEIERELGESVEKILSLKTLFDLEDKMNIK